MSHPRKQKTKAPQGADLTLLLSNTFALNSPAEISYPRTSAFIRG
jgi:hypothetical protein